MNLKENTFCYEEKHLSNIFSTIVSNLGSNSAIASFDFVDFDLRFAYSSIALAEKTNKTNNKI